MPVRRVPSSKIEDAGRGIMIVDYVDVIVLSFAIYIGTLAFVFLILVIQAVGISVRSRASSRAALKELQAEWRDTPVEVR